MAVVIFQYRYPWRGEHGQAPGKKALCADALAAHALVNPQDAWMCATITAEREHNPPGPPMTLVTAVYASQSQQGYDSLSQ